MKKCSNCGKELKSQEEQASLRWSGDYCDGVLTMDTNPFAVEINDDFTEYLDCEGNRYEAMMDI